MLRGCLSVAPYYVMHIVPIERIVLCAWVCRGSVARGDDAFSERMSGGYRVDRWEIQCEHRNTKNRLSNYSASGFLFILFGA